MIRRISAAFKDIPGGQILGPTPDYSLRLLDFELLEESGEGTRRAIDAFVQAVGGLEPLPERFPKLVAMLRREGLLVGHGSAGTPGERIFDVTREAITFPAPRSAQLQTLARGETGGLLALAYSNMRGYGSVHPVIGELRVGYLPVAFANPVSGAAECIGEVLVTEAEVIARMAEEGDRPAFSLGYGLCFGHNETKAIAMAVLDRALSGPASAAPSEDQEFVLTHVDGIESMGFCNHYKLPHYVTFQSELDRLRAVQAGPGGGAPMTPNRPVPPRRPIPRPRTGGPPGRPRPRATPSPSWTRAPSARSGADAQGRGHPRLPGALRLARNADRPGVGDRRAAAHACRSSGPEDVLKVIDQGADDSVNAVNIRKFVTRVTGVRDDHRHAARPP